MRQFSLTEAAQQTLAMFKSGHITSQDCDVAIAIYLQMDRECPQYKTVQVGYALDDGEIVPVYETVTIH